MFLLFIRWGWGGGVGGGQKEDLPQRLFLDYLLNKIYFQAETKYILPQATIYVHLLGPQRASNNHGMGHRAKPPWPCLASPHPRVTPSFWSPVAIYLHQASCYKWLVLGGEFCCWKRQKMTSLTHGHNPKEEDTHTHTPHRRPPPPLCSGGHDESSRGSD